MHSEAIQLLTAARDLLAKEKSHAAKHSAGNLDNIIEYLEGDKGESTKELATGKPAVNEA